MKSCATPRRAKAFGLVFFTALLFSGANASSGDTLHWDGSESANWGTAANWVENRIPSDGDTLVFPETASHKSSLNDISGLNLQSIGVEGSGYNLDGYGIGLSGTLYVTVSASVLLDLDLDASVTILTYSAGNTLYVHSPIDLNGHDLYVGGAGSVHLSGDMAGTGALRKYGSGTVYLEAVNSYSGTTTVDAGTLILDAFVTGGLGDPVAVPNGLVIGGNDEGDPLAVVQLSNDDQIIGDVTVNMVGTFDLNGYSDRIGDLILNGGSDVQTGAGILTLGTNSHITVEAGVSGYSTISGNIDVGNGACTFDIISGTLEVTAVMSGSADITKTGDGYMRLASANTFTGTLTVDQAYLLITDSQALGSNTAGTFVNNSAFLGIAGNTAVDNESLTMNSTNSFVALWGYAGSNSWSGPVTLLQDTVIDVQVGDYLNISGPISGPGGLTKRDEGTLILSGSVANDYSGPTVVSDGQLLMGKTTTPYYAIRYGSLTVGDGTGGAGSALAKELSNYQLGSIPITVNADGLIDLNACNDTVGNRLTLSGRGDVQTGAGIMTLWTDSLVTVDSSSSSISGNLNVGSGACTFDIVSGFLNIYAAMSGSANITKTGDGIMVLHHSNTFTGTMTVDQGGLEVSHSLALGSAAAGTAVNNSAVLLMYLGAAVTNESLTLNSSHASGALFGSTGSNSWSGPVTLLQDTTVAATTDNYLNISGPISGAGGLTKREDGTLILSGSGANTYAGSTMVEEGVLVLDKTASVISIPHDLIITNGATARQVTSYTIANDATLTIYGTGVYDKSGVGEIIDSLVLYDGADFDTGTPDLQLYGDGVTVDGGISTISGTLELNPGDHSFNILTDEITIWPGAHCYLNADVVGSGNLVKTGPGRMRMSGNNSYTGTTAVEAGGLMLESDTALGTSEGNTTVNAGSKIYLSAFSSTSSMSIAGESLSLAGGLYSYGVADTWDAPVTLTGTAEIMVASGKSLELSGAIGGSGDLVKTGDGTVTYSGTGPNTYAGDTYVNSGTLELAKTGAAINQAIVGNLIIGDGGGGANADVVRLAASTQIANAVDVTIASSGLLDLDNHGEAIDGISGTGAVDLGSGYLNTGAGNASTEYGGTISGSGAFSKLGSGTLTLTGTNSFSGTTSVSAGTLLVNGSQPSSYVTVAANGALGGTGTVGAVDSDGTVAPGNSAGVLSAASTTMQPGSTFELELDGFNAGDYDQLGVDGLISVSNSYLSVSWGFVPAVGDAFTIIENDGNKDPVLGTFFKLEEGDSLTAGNVTLQITYTGGDGNDVVLEAIEVEPLEDLSITSFESDGVKSRLEWSGGVPFYRVEMKTSLTNGTWRAITPPTRDFSGAVPVDSSNCFYRVSGGN